jgi:hypothetical protein
MEPAAKNALARRLRDEIPLGYIPMETLERIIEWHEINLPRPAQDTAFGFVRALDTAPHHKRD